jgi:hypothetical protein
MFNSYKTDYGKTRAKRPPVYTLTEFARNLGVPYNTMLNRMKVSDDAPAIEFQSKNAKYYKIEDLQKWHEQYDNA